MHQELGVLRSEEYFIEQEPYYIDPLAADRRVLTMEKPVNACLAP